jgi:hypothetical protein
MPRWEKGFHIFWLLGPFILLIERNPADSWLSFLAIAFVIPFGLFFPIRSTDDFFGQWNNIFMCSAIALALAAARTLVPHKPK